MSKKEIAKYTENVAKLITGFAQDIIEQMNVISSRLSKLENPDKPKYQGPKFKPIPPISTHCTKCGYYLRPEDVRCVQCNPTPPLNARVAKIDGWRNVRKIADYDEIENPQWVGCREQQGGTAFGIIPDYPKNLTLALGALEEYCKTDNLCWKIHGWKTKSCQIVKADVSWDKAVSSFDCLTLSEAICEAIVKHSERAKND